MSTLLHEITCAECSRQFPFYLEDRQFLARFDAPDPVACPECREIRRLSHLNQLHLFRRKCAATGESIVSHHPPESWQRVVSQPYFYSEEVDNRDQGREFDFSRPFFDQFAELLRAIVVPALFTDYQRDENCAYTNYAGLNKDCYFIFDSDECRDSYYSYSINSSVGAVDCFRGRKLELCYAATDCRNCYNCAFIEHSEGCRDSIFLANCTACRNCIGCSNLRQKENYLFNRKASAEEIARVRASLSTRAAWDALRGKFDSFKAKFPQKALRGFQNENVVGNYLENCRDAFQCFDCRDLWDCRYCYQSFMPLRTAYDTDETGQAELAYQCTNLGYNAYNVRYSMMCLNQLTNLTYCAFCFSGVSNLFGCAGLKRSSYCILNKQYSEPEYTALTARVVAHMRATGEWGQYFPPELSPYPYNLSHAQLYRPLSRDEVLARGLRWHEGEQRVAPDKQLSPSNRVGEVPEGVAKDVYSCRSCGKGYKIIPQELAFLTSQRLPLPTDCFLCRHLARHSARSPRRLWPGQCASCGTAIEHAYPPGAETVVYCERCYLESLD